jgi:predicted RNA-binding Zn-ribbon protein involved in translation (DUF1610 family)
MAKICPKCKSKDIYLWLGGNLGIIYKCNNCGYRGPVILEEEKR